MDDFQENQNLQPSEEHELSHTDKLVGVFTEPATTFEQTSKFPPKWVDWFIPVTLLIIVAIVSSFVIMSNPVIKSEIMEKQMQRIEENFQSAVESGKMTQEQADEQIDKIRTNMEQGMGNPVFRVIGPLFTIFILFFIIAGVYYIFVKFALKGDGTYSHAMVAYGLPYYILAIQTIVILILSLSLNKPFRDTSLLSFIDFDKASIVGWFLGKLDIFSIWFYAVVSIGFAKMFKSKSTGKYFGMIFGLWLGVSLLFFLLGKAFPFLKNFGF